MLGIVPPPPDITQADAEILTLVRARATGHQNAVAHRRALQQKIGLFIDFEHFRRLCIRDLRDAFHEDRSAKAHAELHPPSRITKNRRGGWLVAFRYYARHAGIEQGVEIVAVNRRGHYDCYLVDKTEKTSNWEKLVRMAEGFGISEEQLRGCLPATTEGAGRASGRGGK